MGTGEFLLHFDALGRFAEGGAYEFMRGISTQRTTIGHFLGVLSPPLYIIGFWHIMKMLEPANQLASRIALAISPLTADFNGDGRPDIVYANLNGDSTLFLSKAGKGNYLKVKLPGDVGSIAATVTVKLSDGGILSRPYVSGEGLFSDSSRTIIFGLGDASATGVEVEYIDGRNAIKTGSFKKQLLDF